MTTPLVSMMGIEKSFSGVKALNGCQFELLPGEVHALVGENGAGKSTMMKILTGVYSKDAGEITVNGVPVTIHNTKDAQKLGIGMIHQELNLAPDLTIAQNIFIGKEPRNKYIPFFVDDEEMNRRATTLLAEINLDLAPTTLTGGLSVAKQQMVEIVKAISEDSQVLIMDEPTAALSDSEIDDLFRIIEKLRAKGVGIVYISHRMDELKRITDRVTVMRDGTYISTNLTSELTVPQVIAMMVGREVVTMEKPTITTDENSEVVLEVRNLARGNMVKDVSFQLRRGEILGVAGLVGAGRTEMARLIFGADQPEHGEIYVHGNKVKFSQPHEAVAHGIGYLSEDRKRYGCMLDMDVSMNVAVSSMDQFTNVSFVNDSQIRQVAQQSVEELRVKTPSIDQNVRYLSGGNQQKVIIGKWLTRDSDILIFDEPTRGIDIGAKSEIYKLLENLAAQGKSILMISSELPEVLRLSHRIIVMCEGRVTGELVNDDLATQEAIMKYATDRSAVEEKGALHV